MTKTSVYGVPSANHGTTRPLSPAERAKRRAREDEQLPLALTVRDGIQPDPERKIPARCNPHLLLDGKGTPAMSPGFENLLCGPKPRALMMALRRLQRTNTETYDHLMAYFVHKKSERQIALESSPPISRWQVASSIRFGVGYLHACLDCDGDHARMRGISVDDLYQDADMTDDDDDIVSSGRGAHDDDDDGLEAHDAVSLSGGSVPGLSAVGLRPSASHGAAAR